MSGPDPGRVTCPTCHAQPGERCVDSRPSRNVGRPRYLASPHPARRQHAIDAAALGQTNTRAALEAWAELQNENELARPFERDA